MRVTIAQLIFTILLLAGSSLTYGQQMHSSKIEIPLLHHEIDGFIGNTHVPEGGRRNTTATLILPNIGFNYKYWFDERFAIGWYNNLVVRTYVVNSDTHQDLDREYPFLTSVVGVLNLWKGLSVFAGPGMEIDKNRTLFAMRFGLDYGFSISNDWYVSPRFIFDHLGGDIEAYTLGIGIGRKF
ncbi:MAG: hypothetical protein MI975_13200 [Cytophagales bacterium]|nr:hypothetical protein [Cytophagales bacterium]